ncbi:MAG: hypothetical protein JW914_05275 [Syntrophaceae bacterium]|nr:hypothetical protein [Syntrophaceae bacterium]
MNDLEAKEFFIQKVLDQARKENINLSYVEKQMLSWRDTDPNFYKNYGLYERFEEEIPTAEYEKKISRLIRGSYDNDLAANNVARETYSQAFKAIKWKDYYIFIMVDKAIGRDINKLRYFLWGDSPNEYILRVVLYGVLFVFGTILFLHENNFTFHEIKTRSTYIFFIIAFAGLIFLNIKSYIKYKKEDIFSNKPLKRNAAKSRRTL